MEAIQFTLSGFGIYFIVLFIGGFLWVVLAYLSPRMRWVTIMFSIIILAVWLVNWDLAWQVVFTILGVMCWLIMRAFEKDELRNKKSVHQDDRFLF